MNKLFLLLTALCFHPLALAGAQRTGTMVLIDAGGEYAAASVGAGDTQSSLKGSGFTAGLEIFNDRVLFRDYGMGFYGRLTQLNLENSKNTATTSEEMEQTRYLIGTRIYAMNLFVGVGVFAGQSVVNSKVGAVATKQKYSDLGGIAEIGMFVHLSDYFYLSPSINYSFSQSQPVGHDGDELKSTAPAARLSLGLQF